MGSEITYIWHDGLPIRPLHIAEGHLGAFVLVDTKLGVIDIRNLVKRNFSG
jgi:hypothetical protein